MPSRLYKLSSESWGRMLRSWVCLLRSRLCGNIDGCRRCDGDFHFIVNDHIIIKHAGDPYNSDGDDFADLCRNCDTNQHTNRDTDRNDNDCARATSDNHEYHRSCIVNDDGLDDHYDNNS